MNGFCRCVCIISLFSTMAAGKISAKDLMGSVADISYWFKKLKKKVTSLGRSVGVLELMNLCDEVEKSKICEYSSASSCLLIVKQFQCCFLSHIKRGRWGDAFFKFFICRYFS